MCEHCNLGQIKTHFPLREEMTLLSDKTPEENESLKLHRYWSSVHYGSRFIGSLLWDDKLRHQKKQVVQLNHESPQQLKPAAWSMQDQEDINDM